MSWVAFFVFGVPNSQKKNAGAMYSVASVKICTMMIELLSEQSGSHLLFR